MGAVVCGGLDMVTKQKKSANRYTQCRQERRLCLYESRRVRLRCLVISSCFEGTDNQM